MFTKKRTWEIIEAARPGDTLSRCFDIFLLILIFLNVIAVIVGSVHSVQQKASAHLQWFEVFSVIVFTVEYLLRLWACSADGRYPHPVWDRLKFALRPMSVVDFLAILPFYLPFLGIDLRFIRALRLLRLLRIAKIGRYYTSLQLIGNVFRSKKEELVLTTAIMAMLLILSSCLIYYCENSAQPDVFPDIPSAMWWSVITLTTVGYGDAFPVTTLGRILAAFIAVLGIGMFALPTGILGAGFVEEIQKRKGRDTICSKCGAAIKSQGEI